MTSGDTKMKGRPIIQGRGLTSPGIVVLYILGLLLIQTLENFISGQPGRVTGIVLLALFFVAIKLGRSGTLFTAVVTPPLALTGTLLFATLLSKGFGITSLLVAILSNLARLAPWLLLTAIVSWSYFFIAERRRTTSIQQPSDPS
jgi:hypothetical protein